MATAQQRRQITRARNDDQTVPNAELIRDEIRRSQSEWRAMQGLPPIDYTKKEPSNGKG